LLMAVDYRERRTVPAKNNRTKKQPVSMIVGGFALVILAAYGLGIATGWLFFRMTPKPTVVAKPSNVQLPATAISPTAANTQPPPGTPASAPTPPAALTFYDTLPKGEKGVMGSGLNPKAGALPKANPVPTATEKVPPPAAVPNSAPLAQVKPLAGTVAPSVDKKPITTPEKRGFYSVQVASSKDKAGAETIKARLADHGKSAYIIVTQLPDKGTWYRVRVGHQLDEVQAKQLAASLGSGAVVVPE
jgi:cell division protein FtsN